MLGTTLLSGIRIALPRIFYILAGANAGATFLPMHIAALFAAVNVFHLSTYGVSVWQSVQAGLPSIMLQLICVPWFVKCFRNEFI